ncbi:MAG: hypothetical protein A2928_01745 [Candidatus Taylorbacteria bacterium RIFCSPLOWO2_01_FULL_45_15b]|uniref:Uncharacterized protein n=1 Tax=Candidatus Taylorbacteria bacterium RIFCSPLOWO2_01_FULL_45_15b TaxID=1802319 RepID=A0A1G2NC30_9BACT|nr:MAG: hypothetical protein A2928_01745 [Candidatus Taylorbacteria bacterium RIFCSPLOWO2_01_FULL_45_15b]
MSTKQKTILINIYLIGFFLLVGFLAYTQNMESLATTPAQGPGQKNELYLIEGKFLAHGSQGAGEMIGLSGKDGYILVMPDKFVGTPKKGSLAQADGYRFIVQDFVE